MPDRDPNEQAVKKVEKITDSEPVSGEELLESEELNSIITPTDALRHHSDYAKRPRDLALMGLARFRATLRRVAEELLLYLSVGLFWQSSRRDNWSVPCLGILLWA